MSQGGRSAGLIWSVLRGLGGIVEHGFLTGKEKNGQERLVAAMTLERYGGRSGRNECLPRG